MDPLDAFYQELDSEELLKRHGGKLAAEARDVLEQDQDAKLAGVILMPDSREAGPFRAALAELSGQEIPEGLLVGLCPRPAIEATLHERVDDELWKEESWQPQSVLPIVVATRDGFRFGFYPLESSPD